MPTTLLVVPLPWIFRPSYSPGASLFICDKDKEVYLENQRKIYYPPRLRIPKSQQVPSVPGVMEGGICPTRFVHISKPYFNQYTMAEMTSKKVSF